MIVIPNRWTRSPYIHGVILRSAVFWLRRSMHSPQFAVRSETSAIRKLLHVILEYSRLFQPSMSHGRQVVNICMKPLFERILCDLFVNYRIDFRILEGRLLSVLCI